MRRTTTIRTTTIVGAGALVLGVVMGGGAGRTDPTEAPAYLALQSNFETVSTDRDALSDEVDSLVDKNAELAADNREMRSAQETLAEDQAQLTSDLEGLESRLAEVEHREKAVAAAEAELTNVAPPPAEPAPAPAPPTSVYYDNCSAARSAGATPVRAGDPGYGRHLDRDGDGVACE